MTQNGNLGHNNPPYDIDAAEADIENIDGEAKNWCDDGEPIKSDDQEAAVDELLKMAAETRKRIEGGKEIEYRPVKTDLDAISKKWNDRIDRVKTIEASLKRLLKPWKDAKAKKAAEEARAAREAAAEKAREAERKAAEAEASNNITSAEEAKALKQEARVARQEARDVAKDGRKGLKKVSHVRVVDFTAFARDVWSRDPEAIKGFLSDYASREFNKGHQAFKEREWAGVEFYQTDEVK